MPINLDRYRVAFLDSRGEPAERVIEIRGVDELRAEKSARAANVRGPSVDARTRQVNDLGDFHNMEALKLWAALVRVGAYDEKPIPFLTSDYLGSEKVDANGDPIKPGAAPETVDPTQPAENTDSA